MPGYLHAPWRRNCLAFISLLTALNSRAQVDVDNLLRSSEIASGYATMINFAVKPDVTAAKLNIDNDLPEDTQLGVVKFPLRHEFETAGNGWTPLMQATLGRLTYKAGFPVLTNDMVQARWTAYTASLGGGVRIPLSERWSLLTAVDAGYAYLANEATYSDGIAGLDPLLRGKLFD
jgi:hypothetical protein